jgi:hypothetical protein
MKMVVMTAVPVAIPVPVRGEGMVAMKARGLTPMWGSVVGRACRAGTIKNQLMAFHRKTWGQHAVEFPRTGSNFKDLAAHLTMEVMVMGLAGDFVAGRLAGQIHGRQPVLVEQAFDRAIDGGHPQPWDDFLRLVQKFLRAQRASRKTQGLTDGSTLYCFALHHE